MFRGLVDGELEDLILSIMMKAKHEDIYGKRMFHESTKQFYDPFEWVMVSEAIRLNSNFGSNDEFNDGLLIYSKNGNAATGTNVNGRVFVTKITRQIDHWEIKFGVVQNFVPEMSFLDMITNSDWIPKRSGLAFTEQMQLFSTIFSVLLKFIDDNAPDKIVFSGTGSKLGNIYRRAFASPDTIKFLSEVGYESHTEIRQDETVSITVIPKEQ